MKLLNKEKIQRGESTASILLLIVAAVLVGTFAFKAVPAYMKNNTIKAIMEDVQKDPATVGENSKQVKRIFLNRLKTNSIYEFNRDNVTVTSDRQGMMLRVAYQVQTKYMFNIDLLLHFDHSVEIPPI
ncbi:DUF4845 domain-containing protein [Solemya elarraichensis gill symbiont]|uniref:DUF4845 domain-containing protein n=1 Tax=Solemya elarraichensis gill symbiont TaxID=1918949 RepID=A0A1T2LAI4_9GAMM|nr:DUF4845 domain-containing protein [Solemya elarraichensis gill symbiont]OOZ42101.1 hypothetical protein BOW52_03655 [Solemya elarraichensis gill symbiont]